VRTTCYAIETQPLRGNIDFRHISLNRNAEFEAVGLPNLAVLYRKALHMLRDADAAEYTVQETCLRAWEIFDQFMPGTNGRAWLFAILMNVLKHELRRSGRCRIDPRSHEILETCAAATNPGRDVFSDQHLAAAIEGMPPQFREVLLMAVISEMQYREIASRLQIPLGTVMSRLARAGAPKVCVDETDSNRPRPQCQCGTWAKRLLEGEAECPDAVDQGWKAGGYVLA
jgi:RNA polymerase sigma-70 factor, ECF subfamily